MKVQCYSAKHCSLLQRQVNVSMTVRLLHRFVRQSWHPTALMLDTDLPKLTNHRKKDNLGTRLLLF